MEPGLRRGKQICITGRADPLLHFHFHYVHKCSPGQATVMIHLYAFALTFFNLECFPRWSSCCFTSRAHRIRAAEMIVELREGQSDRCCCRFLLWSHRSPTVCTCTLLHRQGWGWIWDEGSITVLLSGMGGVFSQLKSNRLADFHSSL